MVQTSHPNFSNDVFFVHCEVKAQDQDEYVFDGVLNNDSSIVAASLSSNKIKLYTLETLQYVTCFTGHTKTITGIKFSHQNPNCLYSSSLDGTICLWDVRKKENPALSFRDDTGKALKPFASFDINRDEQFICAGTEIVHEDAFLVFWDTRTSKLLGGYWNSHTDDITQVKFHPNKSSHMASGSVDGLINIFDLSESCEDDALMETLNTCSSVGKLMWLPANDGDQISCLTHTEEYQLWDVEEGKTISVLDRDALSSSGKGKEIQYMIDAYKRDDTLHLATGTTSGDIDIWTLSEDDCTPFMKLYGGHKGVVRSIMWDDKSKALITGGEDGVVCCWRPQSSSSSQQANSNVGKVESHLKSLSMHHKKKPYVKAFSTDVSKTTK